MITCYCVTSWETYIAWPFSWAWQGSRLREVVHAGFLWMEPAKACDENSMLVMKYVIISYVWLQACTSADSDAAVSILSRWPACFRCIEWLLTDQGSRFVASIEDDRTTESRKPLHFTTPYCALACATAERHCKEVLWIANVFRNGSCFRPDGLHLSKGFKIRLALTVGTTRKDEEKWCLVSHEDVQRTTNFFPFH